MSKHYDPLETRDPAEREREQCGRLPEIIANAMRAPGWAKHLAGIDARAVSSREALAKLPVLIENAGRSKYKVHLDPGFNGADSAPVENTTLAMWRSPEPAREGTP